IRLRLRLRLSRRIAAIPVMDRLRQRTGNAAISPDLMVSARSWSMVIRGASARFDAGPACRKRLRDGKAMGMACLEDRGEYPLELARRRPPPDADPNRPRPMDDRARFAATERTWLALFPRGRRAGRGDPSPDPRSGSKNKALFSEESSNQH